MSINCLWGCWLWHNLSLLLRLLSLLLLLILSSRTTNEANIHFICDNSRTITNDNVVVNVVIAAPVSVCVRVSVFAWRKKTHKMRSMILCRAIVTYRRVAITAEAHFVCASSAKNRAAPSQQQQQQLHTKQALLLSLSLSLCTLDSPMCSLCSPHTWAFSSLFLLSHGCGR